MMSGMNYSPGDLVGIPFPYSDLKTEKRRPVLVMTHLDRHGDFTLLLQKSRMPQIQDVQGRSRNILLRALGNEVDGASSAFPSGKKHDKSFICF